ncbi:MAG: hypothetical protein JHC31_04505 [Sulfurihydrogenibium sp.]|nr:hypothetical protein [Sulfurihydrogenibium sp.]
MDRKYKHFPLIIFAGGLFYFSLIFYNAPMIMMSIIFLAISLVYVPTGSIKLAMFSPIVFLIGAITGMKPFIDEEKQILVLTYKDYVLDTQQPRKQLFGILMLE